MGTVVILAQGRLNLLAEALRTLTFNMVLEIAGKFAQLGHAYWTFPRGTALGFTNIIKYGTFCRTIIWPCLPPLLMYHYIRGKDEDMYATEVLYYKSGATDAKAFYDKNRIGASAHWRVQQDMELIRQGANPE